ncbi:MAG: NADP-dependent glyceraldehyde-3-phosphate dehydrogenase, partial [Chitinophagaceae bacterium]
MSATPGSIFKTEDSIPKEYIVSEIHQKTYLLNGELVDWRGPVANVYSPVCVLGANGPE